MAELTVRGAEGAYPVIVAPGALAGALPAFVAARGFTRAAVVTNTTLAPLYGAALAARLPGGTLITVPDGEQYKTLDTLRAIYDDLLAAGADRATLIVGLGGGVIGDVAGFAAATFMRGVPFIQAPTSLLAMVDASIGGKVGVDLPQGKNLAGAFKDPLAVFADTESAPREQDRWRFLTETEKSYFDRMYRVIRDEVGCKALVTGTIVFGPCGQYAQTDMDFIDAHAYWQHPRFPGRPGPRR